MTFSPCIYKREKKNHWQKQVVRPLGGKNQYLDYRAKKEEYQVPIEIDTGDRYLLFRIDVHCRLWCSVNIAELAVNEPSQVPETIVGAFRFSPLIYASHQL